MEKPISLSLEEGANLVALAKKQDRILEEMNRVEPWVELVAVIEPVYPKAEGLGRPPVGIARRLRLYCLQQKSRCDVRVHRKAAGTLADGVASMRG